VLFVENQQSPPTTLTLSHTTTGGDESNQISPLKRNTPKKKPDPIKFVFWTCFFFKYGKRLKE
jgi:hypothetical protein